MRRAFTLVELLVAMALIAVLAALLLPVFASARNKAKGSVCISNLSQIGKAIAMYSGDYDDRIPFAPSPITVVEDLNNSEVCGAPYDDYVLTIPDVRKALASYGPSQPIWICPLDRIDDILALEGGHASTFYQESGSSYRYDDCHALQGRTLSQYPTPSSNVLVQDISGFHGGKGLASMSDILFADLHVKVVPNAERIDFLSQDP